MAVIRERLSLLCQAGLLSVAISILASPAAMAAQENHQTGQVTVFWGRHKDEGSLREACDSGMYTHVIISFLNAYGHGVFKLDVSGHQLDGIGYDIKHCQLVGIPVSLSVRGTNNYSLPNGNNQSALDLANHVWNAYLGGYRNGVHRPFGDAKLDGADLFLERGVTTSKPYYDMIGRELAKLIGMGTGNNWKAIHVTATLPCAFVMNHPAMSHYERIHVRFFDEDGHNNGCNAYSEEVWDRWAATYPSSRIFLGLPASPEAAKEGYLYPKSLYYGVLPIVQKAANYGGVMLWDRYYDKSANYSSYVKRWA
ncbi:hypothetical protein HU200_058922 [Digitaria exilis]|uniref:GH18 domain-containing protein n=1 Tax=Digitaria exilis TaxID=1010633 RepID=A0A835AIA4_9POAL|nr:hypothetical protein HU200_058922 [Digitaria exilis]